MAPALDPAALPRNMARSVRGFFPARHGKAELTWPLVTASGLDPGEGRKWAGVAVYRTTGYGTTAPENDYVIAVDDLGRVRSYELRPTMDPTWSGGGALLGSIPLPDDPPLRYGTRNVRSVQWMDELILVMEGAASTPVRIYKNSQTGILRLDKLGLDTPLSAPTHSSSGTGITGTYRCKYTLADNKGRESSPSPVSTDITVTNKTITWTAPLTALTGPALDQLAAVHFYRNISGGTALYRTGTVTISSRPTANITYADSTSDADLLLNDLCPRAGSNDPPQMASLVAVWNNRLVLNDRSDLSTPADREAPHRLQISNLYRPTQFSTDTSTYDETDGAVVTIGSEAGDRITGIRSAGSMLGIWKRNAFYVMTGDDIDTWTARYVHTVGCDAPDTICERNGVFLYHNKDGFYAMSAASGFVPQKISDPIECRLVRVPPAE